MSPEDWLRRIKGAFMREDDLELRQIGGELVKLAVQEDSKDFADLSVLAYVLAKILTKVRFARSPNWKEWKENIIGWLDLGVKECLRKISELEGQSKVFVQGLVEKGRVKQASTAYALGISLSRACELFGVSKRELMDYVGKTRIHDEEEARIGIGERVDALWRRQHASGL